MSSDLISAMRVAQSGLSAQSFRMRVIAENIANQNSVAAAPGGDPYRRRMPTIRAEFSKELGAAVARADRVTTDSSAFGRRYEPGNPAADTKGYVLTPNVSGLVETADMRAAQRSYEANLSTIEATRSMMNRTLDLLK